MKLNYETNRLRDSQFVVNQTNLAQAENPCRMLPTFRRPLFLSALIAWCAPLDVEPAVFSHGRNREAGETVSLSPSL